MDNVKQVYATLKLDDNKVDILVGEFPTLELHFQ